ncbi:hypothetical protein [Candidatus Poriferisocius sp.]|uniref:hypothetical protein n=1 Tax=Candidatus Poriferisocius sp. TaxID=3101276 RepID=UPI003B018673
MAEVIIGLSASILLAGVVLWFFIVKPIKGGIEDWVAARRSDRSMTSEQREQRSQVEDLKRIQEAHASDLRSRAAIFQALNKVRELSTVHGMAKTWDGPLPMNRQGRSALYDLRRAIRDARYRHTDDTIRSWLKDSDTWAQGMVDHLLNERR